MPPVMHEMAASDQAAAFEAPELNDSVTVVKVRNTYSRNQSYQLRPVKIPTCKVARHPGSGHSTLLNLKQRTARAVLEPPRAVASAVGGRPEGVQVPQGAQRRGLQGRQVGLHHLLRECPLAFSS